MGIFSRSSDRRDETAAEIARQIHALLPDIKGGSLRFWGVWFGRPGDNHHTILRAEADGNCLTLHFNQGETLKIWNPAGCKISAQQFWIHSAWRVCWSWYWYGRPASPENLMTYDFVRENGVIHFQSNFPHHETQNPNVTDSAVEIC